MDEKISNGLSLIGTPAQGSGLVYRKLSLPGIMLSDISFLMKFRFLEYLELQSNCIVDVSPLSHLPFLFSIDVEDNQIESFLSTPLENLQGLIISRNKLSSLNFEQHVYLRNLSANCLEKCSYMTHLSVHGNKISSLKGLASIPLRFLDLRNNLINDITETEFIPTLETLLISNNPITDLFGLSAKCEKLMHLDVAYTGIDSLECISHLKKFKSLSNLLIITGNKIIWPQPQPKNIVGHVSKAQDLTGFLRLHVLFNLDYLSKLEDSEVKADEKIAAQNYFAPSPYVNAVNAHATRCESEMRRFAPSLSSPCTFAPIVLCGPVGVGKRTIIAQLMDDFPHVFGRCVGHTTRDPRPGETNGVDYHFVTMQRMQEMVCNGEMASVIKAWGHWYGTTIEACKRVKSEGKIGLFHMEVAGALAFHSSSLVPARYIMLVPPSLKELERRQQRISDFNHHRVSSSREEIAEMIEFWMNQARQASNFVQDEMELPSALFERIVVNEDMQDCYEQIKRVCLRELREKYMEELDCERQQLDGVGIISY